MPRCTSHAHIVEISEPIFTICGTILRPDIVNMPSTSYIGRRSEEGDPRVVASSVAGIRRQGHLPVATSSPEHGAAEWQTY